ncbi:MAG: response regulator [Myxococcales bacterium]|nr:response regulator [Myxococcales bacterium]
MTVDVRALLELSEALQRSSTFTELLNAARGAVVRTTRYRSTWLMAVEDTPEGQWCRILAMEGGASELVWERAPRFPVGADPFLREILEGDHPVIVEDMRTDPRTDKEIISRTDHRTAISIPMRIEGAPLGMLCVGTFGAEGVIAPTAEEVEHLTIFAALVAAAFDRIRLLLQRNALDEQARSLAEKSRALEEQLRHLQRLETAGQLASGIAHDFNNLLTAIAGHAEISLYEVPPGPVAESLAVILEATKRGSHLTHNLLSFSRRRVLSRRVSDLNAIVDKARALILPAIQPGIALRFSPAEDEVTAFVDEVELEHAIINLVTNARDAIQGAGEISIEVRTTELDDDFVMRHEGKLVGRCACVMIRDTGVGIPEEILAQVFEPFFTTKGAGRGTGLGLATVRSLVDRHGGVVSVDSELGRGTTFALYLPLATGDSAPRPLPAAARTGGGGETILVAEDDDVVRALLARVLRGHGYQVLEASDGQSAIDLFRAESSRVSLVLTDLLMPRRSGLDLVDAVVAFKQKTPIVVMSGYTSDPEGASRLTELGLPMINKPTTPTEVLLKIRHILDAAGSLS